MPVLHFLLCHVKQCRSIILLLVFNALHAFICVKCILKVFLPDALADMVAGKITPLFFSIVTINCNILNAYLWHNYLIPFYGNSVLLTQVTFCSVIPPCTEKFGSKLGCTSERIYNSVSSILYSSTV